MPFEEVAERAGTFRPVRKRDAVAGAGGTVLTATTEHRPGAAFALVADPDGNVWELLQESAGG